MQRTILALGATLLTAAALPVIAQTTPTQIGPVYAAGNPQGQSFLRVFDPGNRALGVTVTLLAADGVRALATWSATVPPLAARQFSLAEIEAAALPHLATGDLPATYRIAVDGDAPGFAQHVVWRASDASLQMVSGCGVRAMTPARYALNVHTDLLPSYPSVVTLKNGSGADRTATFDVYDAATGARVSGYGRSVPANTSLSFTEARFAADTGFAAKPGQYHLNFVLAADFAGSVSHAVVNSATGALQSMAETCALPGTASDGLEAPALPTTSYAYADARVSLAAIYTNPNVPGSAAATDNTPANNPITDAGATLGRVLFYDKRLSANNTVACASCHQQARGFGDGARLSAGFNGGLTARHAMALTDARFYQRGRFFWDERAATLEDQVLQPIQNAVEMGMTLDALVTKLSATDFYPALFKAAFGSETVSADRIAKALAQFVRSLTSSQSKFDRAIAAGPGGPARVLTAQEQQGFQLFGGGGPGPGPGRSVGCARCHTTAAQVLDAPHNNGLDVSNAADQGAGNGRFKAPSLRNVAVRGRYMHDGRFASLAAVIDFYDRGVQPNPNLAQQLRAPDGSPRRLNLSPQEKDALIAFLNTLTDDASLTDPRLSDPFAR
jgi:cytochrome c peroxidase